MFARHTTGTAIKTPSQIKRRTYTSVSFYWAAVDSRRACRTKTESSGASVEGAVLNNSERRKEHFLSFGPWGSTVPLPTCCWLPWSNSWVTARWLLPVCVFHSDESCQAQFDDGGDVAVEVGRKAPAKEPNCSCTHIWPQPHQWHSQTPLSAG